MRFKGTHNLSEFCKYFLTTYVGTVGSNGRLLRARFALETWNCFERTLAGVGRTNNAIEGWHAHLNALFPRAHLPLSQFIVRMQKEDERTHNC